MKIQGFASLKVTLLNPAVNFDRQFGTLQDFYTPIPSIALAYIGAVLLEDGFEVSGIDSFMACHTSEEMYDVLDDMDKEISLYHQYSDQYGYTFYILKAI